MDSHSVRPGKRVSRLRTVLVLLVWMTASGSVWDIVQLYAWGSMWAANLEDRSVTEAFVETFSEDAMCGLCKVVQEAKQDPRDPTPLLTPAIGKAPLLPVDTRSVRITPPRSRRQAHQIAEPMQPESRRVEPMVPPPRAA